MQKSFAATYRQHSDIAEPNNCEIATLMNDDPT